MAKEKRIVVLTTRVDETLGKAIQALAAAENRNVSNYLETLLRQHVAEQAAKGAKPKRGEK
jgi:predicted transcriptional regulator